MRHYTQLVFSPLPSPTFPLLLLSFFCFFCAGDQTQDRTHAGHVLQAEQPPGPAGRQCQFALQRTGGLCVFFTMVQGRGALGSFPTGEVFQKRGPQLAPGLPLGPEKDLAPASVTLKNPPAVVLR